MLEKMSVTVEVWPLAADEAGIWLLSGGDALAVSARSGATATCTTRSSGCCSTTASTRAARISSRSLPKCRAAAVIHSTIWRPDGPAVVLTYMAVVGLAGTCWRRGRTPRRSPSALPAAVGKAPPHGAAEVPVPRVVDVLLHGLRHLKFLAGPDGDAETAAALDANLPRHLAPLRPALAEMFSERLAG